MTNKDSKKIFLPQCDGRALDFIKICAAFFMVIDHTNSIWFDHQNFSMFLIGRGTFPLFCYAVAVALEKAGPEKSGYYIAKLLMLAMIVQPVFAWAFDQHIGNVLFTLAAGAAFTIFLPRLSLPQTYAIYICSIILMVLPSSAEFGLAGVMLPSAFVLALRREKGASFFLILLLLFINNSFLLNSLLKGIPPASWEGQIVINLVCVVLPLIVLNIAKDLDQTRRFLPKYALHIFYPVHLILIKIAGMIWF